MLTKHVYRARLRPVWALALHIVVCISLALVICLAVFGLDKLFIRLHNESVAERNPLKTCDVGYHLQYVADAWVCVFDGQLYPYPTYSGAALLSAGTITSSGTLTPNLPATTCGPGTAVTAISTQGIGTCGAVK